jgi:hypothetical protein
VSGIICLRAQAQQQFNSTSDGSDGALNITAPGVTYLDPVALKLNPKNGNIFNFTTITIAKGSVLKLSDLKFHGPVFFLAQGDVVINGAIDLSGDDSPGPSQSPAEENPEFAGSGGYSGGLGGIHGDSNHQALPGNGPGGGAPGDVNVSNAPGGVLTANHFLQPLVGGSGGGGVNDNGRFGAQGGAGAGALLIASSGTIRLDGDNAQITSKAWDGRIEAFGGAGTSDSGGGAGGAVRLVANSIVGADNYYIQVDGGGSGGAPGIIRIEANNINYGSGNTTGVSPIFSAPFDLNLPTAPPPVLRVVSVNGLAVSSNPFQFPSVTINTSASVPVVINATNVPLTSKVTLYVLSDKGPNQAIPVTLAGSNTSSTATVPVPFPPVGSRGFLKAVFQ